MLIKRHGFSYRDVIGLTPRQIAAFLEHAEAIDRIDAAQALHRGAMAAQGTGKAIDDEIKRLMAEKKERTSIAAGDIKGPIVLPGRNSKRKPRRRDG